MRPVARVSSCARRFASGLALASALPFFSTGAHAEESRLDAVKRNGELVMLTHPGATTYYRGPEGVAGFEFDLARLFAEHLGVRLRVSLAGRADVLPQLLRGRADFAAGGITVSQARDRPIRITPAYHQMQLQFVYRHGDNRPRNVAELAGREIAVQAGTIYAERLRALAARHPGLAWTENRNRRPEEHLERVWRGQLDVTLVDSDTLAANRPYYPEALAAFGLPQAESLVWAFRLNEDDSLYREAVAFIAAQRRAGTIAQLIDRYYGPGSRANFINLSVFHQRARSRLPRFRRLFERAAAAHDLDWRLLAAIGYQESYWNPRSISPTGVRGVMMLTRVTARELGVKNRLDPQASIDGGARYLRSILERLPARIPNPDRLWLALAGYNVGPSHLEDARVLTEKRGGDPDRWTDVRTHLPLLADPRWYPRTRYGYARGREPVRYVDRVRVFYDALQKLDSEGKVPPAAPAFDLRAPAI